MSKLKTKFDSISLKNKISDLLESIDRNNTSKMILERYYSNLSALEVSEGKSTPKETFADLTSRGIDKANAQNLISNSILAESRTAIADSYLLNRIQILESAMRELKSYSWVPKIKNFLEESSDFLKENQTYILIESVMRDLELDRNRSYYTKAINILRESSNSDNPVFYVTENLSSEKWIPLVKQLFEYCEKIKGSINGTNPNFKVSKIYSPVEVNESTYTFYSNGKLLDVNEGSISESSINPSEDFKALINIVESSKFTEKGIRVYPNIHSTLDISFGDETKVSLNGKLIEAKNVDTILLSSAIVRMNEQEKLAMIGRAINEGSKIKEIDFGYRVSSSVFEGLSVSVFNLNNKIYIQKNNKGMKENSFIETSSANEAVQIVKDFMNYDITESISSLVMNEREESEKRTREISKIEDRIRFVSEKLSDILAAEKVIGKSDILDQAKEIIESELSDQNSQLERAKFAATKSINESTSIEVGKEYTIKGKSGYIYQGVADGYHIFNQKDETAPTPIHMKEEEFQAALSAGEITK